MERKLAQNEVQMMKVGLRRHMTDEVKSVQNGTTLMDKRSKVRTTARRAEGKSNKFELLKDQDDT